MEQFSPIFNIIFGLLLLFAGQKLFWLFIGVLGFMFGFNLAEYYLFEYPEWAILIIGITAGLVGIILAILAQRIAIILAGVLVGISMAINAFIDKLQGSEYLMLLALIAGGLLGGVLFAIFFDWALIVFSALLGAALITELLTFEPIVNNLIFLGLTITGVIIQVKFFSKKQEMLPVV